MAAKWGWNMTWSSADCWATTPVTDAGEEWEPAAEVVERVNTLLLMLRKITTKTKIKTRKSLAASSLSENFEFAHKGEYDVLYFVCNCSVKDLSNGTHSSAYFTLVSWQKNCYVFMCSDVLSQDAGFIVWCRSFDNNSISFIEPSLFSTSRLTSM